MLGFRTQADQAPSQSPVTRVFNWSELRKALAHGFCSLNSPNST
jgi:hypothetical protein